MLVVGFVPFSFLTYSEPSFWRDASAVYTACPPLGGNFASPQLDQPNSLGAKLPSRAAIPPPGRDAGSYGVTALNCTPSFFFVLEPSNVLDQQPAVSLRCNWTTTAGSWSKT